MFQICARSTRIRTAWLRYSRSKTRTTTIFILRTRLLYFVPCGKKKSYSWMLPTWICNLLTKLKEWNLHFQWNRWNNKVFRVLQNTYPKPSSLNFRSIWATILLATSNAEQSGPVAVAVVTQSVAVSAELTLGSSGKSRGKTELKACWSARAVWNSCFAHRWIAEKTEVYQFTCWDRLKSNRMPLKICWFFLNNNLKFELRQI